MFVQIHLCGIEASGIGHGGIGLLKALCSQSGCCLIQGRLVIGCASNIIQMARAALRSDRDMLKI